MSDPLPEKDRAALAEVIVRPLHDAYCGQRAPHGVGCGAEPADGRFPIDVADAIADALAPTIAAMLAAERERAEAAEAAVRQWMTMTIAADGCLFRIRKAAESWRDGCNSYLRDAATEIIAICDTRDETVEQLRAALDGPDSEPTP